MIMSHWRSGLLILLSLLALLVGQIAYVDTGQGLTFWAIATGVIAIFGWAAFRWAPRNPSGWRSRVLASILGAVLGSVVAGLIVIVTASIAVAGCTSSACEEKFWTIVLATPVGMVVGAIVGGRVGYVLARSRQRHGRERLAGSPTTA